MALLAISCAKNDEEKGLNGRGFVGFAIDDRVGEYAANYQTKANETNVGHTVLTDNSHGISLWADISDMGDRVYTRGTILDSSSFVSKYQADGFGVFGYQYVAAPYIAGNGELKMGDRSKGAWISYDSAYKVWHNDTDLSDWGSNKMAFFAYAPRVIYTGTIMTVDENKGAPTISYTVPADMLAHLDLLVSKNVDIDKPQDNIVHLTFKHILTAIRFQTMANLGGKVLSITLKNIISAGIYNMDTSTWISTSGLTDYVFPGDKIGGAYNENMMFMIPQALTDNSILEVKYSDNADPNTIYTFKTSLKPMGNEWRAGEQVTYIIAPDLDMASEFKFEIGDIPDITYAGVQGASIAVKSRLLGKSSGNVLKDNVIWNVDYSVDNGNTYSINAPNWLSIVRDGITNDAILTVRPQDSTTSMGGKGWLAERGTAVSPYNLSNSLGGATVENTANCYIVNGPGWYKIPLVYGNAIKNGQPNPVAYTSSNKTFVTHLGYSIVDPYLYKNGINNEEAVIVWQDNDAISEVRVAKEFLEFYVKPSTLKYDNAVLAVRDGSSKDSTIMWSWHIWVTDYQPDLDNFTYKSVGSLGDAITRTVMLQNLGYLPAASIEVTHIARSCKVRFTAEDPARHTTRIIIKDILQPEHRELVQTSESVLYYQWGRKDPMTPSSRVDRDPIVPYKFSIQHPSTFYYCSIFYYDWEEHCYDAWHSGISGDDDLRKCNAKTIYDPSPVGYCVPNSYALSGFTNSIFPKFGLLDIEGNLKEAGSSGHYWSACAGSDNNGYGFKLDASGTHSRDIGDRTYGYPIIAVSEEKENSAPDKSDIDVNDFDNDNPSVTPPYVFIDK